MLDYEFLTQLINNIELSTSRQPFVAFIANVWIDELHRNQEYFRRNDDGEFVYLGNKIIVIGDKTPFVELADKMI